MHLVTDEIKETALSLGFDKVGIVRAEALTEEGERLQDWLRRGFHGEMAWLEREPEKRAEPALLMPGAKSVIVTALNYFTDHPHSPSQTTGKISRYAWGDDYHDVLREKLEKLLSFIRGVIPGVAAKICVDTAPLMDKAWAVRAGLGWLGKHSNMITQELGSWVFIGSIILDVELEYNNAVVEDHCGTCTACLDACPTNAIVEPYVVDSRKCISYATIESRDETLPGPIASNLNGWMYGCDICQDVCPWNRFEKPTREARFEPRRGETSLDLGCIAEMTHEQYVERFRRSAMKRTKLAGLKRNASALADHDDLN
ncbi:MAG: tRNA epoxyqueuosine(34) reductase QueG [Acidobacteria bacterium]|nr:tRNA epoxyqueuosine(34) reductase QueG [Acidobacteriota bacterium]